MMLERVGVRSNGGAFVGNYGRGNEQRINEIGRPVFRYSTSILLF